MTAESVAQWMVDEVSKGQYVYQETIVYQIASKFGDKFTYSNRNGNRAISPKVLAEFRKLTVDAVIWNRGSRFWRKREKYDQLGRQQN